MGYGAFLRETRRQRGLSLRGLADQARVNYVTIKQVEDGTSSPTFDTLTAILHALGVPFKDFLMAAGYKEPRKGKKVSRAGFEPATR